MGDLARTLIALGALLVLAGLLLLLLSKTSFMGRLPGDIVIKRENWTVFFPLGTGILVSIVLSLLLALFFRSR